MERFNFSRNSIRTPPIPTGEYVLYTEAQEAIEELRERLHDAYELAKREHEDAEAAEAHIKSAREEMEKRAFDHDYKDIARMAFRDAAQLLDADGGEGG